MISDLFDFAEIKKKKDFGIKRYKNATYRGQLGGENDQREGWGVLVNDSGRVYEGEWKDNKRSGNGFEKHKNGNT